MWSVESTLETMLATLPPAVAIGIWAPVATSPLSARLESDAVRVTSIESSTFTLDALASRGFRTFPND